jgi:hypothetical protein
LQEILSRFETLRNENRRLKKEQETKDKELNEILAEIEKQKKY